MLLFFFCKKLSFFRNTHFCRKLAEIAEKFDHNIDPWDHVMIFEIFSMKNWRFSPKIVLLYSALVLTYNRSTGVCFCSNWTHLKVLELFDKRQQGVDDGQPLPGGVGGEEEAGLEDAAGSVARVPADLHHLGGRFDESVSGRNLRTTVKKSFQICIFMAPLHTRMQSNLRLYVNKCLCPENVR
jgi:hypothetical protein